MAVLGVTAIAVGTTTTKTTAQSAPTGRATGGGPSSTESVRRSAPTLLNSAGTAPERCRTPTVYILDVTSPTPVDHSGSALYWPVPYFDSIVHVPVDPPAAGVTAAIMAGAAAAAVVPNPFVVPIPASSTLRPVPAVTTPVAATAALPAPVETVWSWPVHPRRAEPMRAHSEAPASAVLTGGTAGDADVDPRLSRITAAPAAIAGRTAGGAVAGVLRDRTAVGAGPAADPRLSVPSATITPTSGLDTAPAAWSRHETAPAELFADLGSASTGLHAQTGFDQLLVQQLLGAG